MGRKFAMMLAGSLVTIRKPLPEDFAHWRFFMNDLDTMQALIPYFKRDTWTTEALRERYEGKGISLSVIRNSDQKIVGTCGFKNIDLEKKRAELGTILHKETWGKGLSEECKLLCFEHGFEVMKLEAIYLHTDTWNERAKKHLAKIGVPYLHTSPEGFLHYELTAADWPRTKALLQRRISESDK